MSAAAPSLIPDELPAVTVPSSLNAGFSFASFSTLESERGCSSSLTSAVPLCTAAISLVKNPSAFAFA